MTIEELQKLLEEERKRNEALEKKNASLAQENEHLESSLALAHEAEQQTNIISEDDVLKDARGLLHGSRAGKIVIENEPDHVIKGRGKMILDETGKNEIIVDKVDSAG